MDGYGIASMIQNMYDEIDSAERYYHLAEKAKKAGEKDVYNKAVETAKEELAHFLWQYNNLMSTLDDVPVEYFVEAFEAICHRNKKLYDKMKEKLEKI